MSPEPTVVFKTERLVVRYATIQDVDLFYALWTSPVVMRHVGFPRGLRITREEIRERLSSGAGEPFSRHLVVASRVAGESLGEARLARPDGSGVVEPDVKLLPEFWGRGYGAEVWRGLVVYEFQHTECHAVQGTPNVDNIASIRMQEAASALLEGEDLYRFPESMRGYTAPVHHYVYRVYRKDWQERHGQSA